MMSKECGPNEEIPITPIVPLTHVLGIQCYRPAINEVDDENTCGVPKRRKKMVYTPEQVSILEKVFEGDSYPCKKKLETLGVKLGMTEDRIRNWFQNRRARLRRQMKKRQTMFDSLVARGLGPQVPGTVSMCNRVVSPIVSSYTTVVVHNETNRSFNSPPINVQSKNERSTCLTNESRERSTFLSNESKETFSNLFYVPRLSTASQTFKRHASDTVSKSPSQKKLHQRAYVRPFNAVDENVGHSLQSRGPLPAINRLLFPTACNAQHPINERAVTPTEYKVTTFQTVVSSQNVYQYGLPHNAIYRPASQHYQPPGIQPYSTDLYQMILQYYAASGSNYNFMTPLPNTYQFHQSSRLQLNTPNPITNNWTNLMNFNDNSNCLPWYNLLMAYQQQALLQTAMNNSSSESVKNPIQANNNSSYANNFAQRSYSSCASSTGSISRTDDSVSVEDSLPVSTDYAAFNLEPNSTWQADQVCKNLLEDRSSKYFRPIDVPKSSTYVRNENNLQADSNNNFLTTDDLVHGKGNLTMENYNLKTLFDEKPLMTRANTQVVDENAAHFKTPSASYLLQAALAFEKEGLDQSLHREPAVNITDNGNIKREAHYQREETFTTDQNKSRETSQAWDEYVHKKMSLRSTKPRSTHCESSSGGATGVDLFWNNNHKSNAHTPFDNATYYGGADMSQQSSLNSCGNAISDIDRHNISMFLTQGHSADMWNKGQYFNESISDEETSYGTDIQSMSMCRDTEDTDSAFSPQFNPPSNQSLDPSISSSQSLANVSPINSPEEGGITPQKTSTEVYERRFSMEESDEN